MNKKRLLSIVFCCSFFCLFGVKAVRAEYFEHHTDWVNYCMEAKEVQLSDRDRMTWARDGTLGEMLVEKSELFVNQFHSSDSTHYWSQYEGEYDVDTSQIETYKFAEGEAFADVSATIYIDAEDKGWNYIVIGVRIMADETTLKDEIKKNSGQTEIPDKVPESTETNKEKPIKDTDKFGQKAMASKQETGSSKMFLIWFALAGIASAGFGFSLHSDFKVLFRYRLKKREWEEGH